MNLLKKSFVLLPKMLTKESYRVDISFKLSEQYFKIVNSFRIARTRFSLLEKRLERDYKFFSKYKKYINHYIALGHVIPFNMLDSNKTIDTLCHMYVVIGESSVRAKFRDFWDASAKTSNGY